MLRALLPRRIGQLAMMTAFGSLCIAALLACIPRTSTAQPATKASSAAQAPGTILLTIILKHDQSKTLEEINAHLDRTGFRTMFPPPDTEVVSWYVMMGIGQVVTLRVPADKLREVNLAVERGAWGAFQTEFYATYDFKPIAEELTRAARQRGAQTSQKPAPPVSPATTLPPTNKK